MIEKLILVGCGGALGAIGRYLAVAWVGRALGPAFPWGTLAVNVAGSFAMGLAVVLIVDHFGAARIAPLVLAGLLGGFTTFSAFSFDAIQLIERERWAAAAGYVSASVLLSILALGIGVALARAAVSG